MACPHGVPVWQPQPGAPRKPNGKEQLQSCSAGNSCRSQLQARVAKECQAKVTRLGDMFGRDRMFIATCAFGPPSEEFAVLQVCARAGSAP